MARQSSLAFDGFVAEQGTSNALATLCVGMVVLAVLKNAVRYAASTSWLVSVQG